MILRSLKEIKKGFQFNSLILYFFQLIYSACALGGELFMLPSCNALPDLSSSILRAWKVKDFETAKKNQDLYTTAFQIFKKYGNHNL